MSDTDSTPKDEALASLQEAGRLVAANLDAAVFDIMTTSTPPVAGITMLDPTTASVASATAITYNSVVVFSSSKLMMKTPLTNPLKLDLSSRRSIDLQ